MALAVSLPLRAEDPAAALAAAPAPALEALKQGILHALAVARRGEEPPPFVAAVAPEQKFLAALAVGDDDLAWPLMKRLAVLAPDHPWGEIGMARIYVHWRIQDQASAAFARALKLAAGNPILLVERAAFHRTFGDALAARADAESVLAQDPGDARALQLLAQLVEDAGAPQAERKAAWSLALQQSDELFEAKEALLAIAEAEDDVVNVAHFVDDLAAADPKSVKLQRKLARARRAAGDRAGEAVALERAMQLGDASKETLNQLAQVHRGLKDTDAEEKVLRRLRRIDPKDRAPVVRLFNLRSAARDGAGMEEQARALLALDPKDAGAHLALAYRRAEAGDRIGQLEELEEAATGNASPEAKNAPERARAEASALRTRLRVPDKQLVAHNATAIYLLAEKHLTALYEEMRRDRPSLRGRLTLRLRIGAGGGADLVEKVEDELSEPELCAGLMVWLKEGSYPKEATSLLLKFDLAPPGAMLSSGHGARLPSARSSTATPPKIEGGGRAKSANDLLGK